MRFLKIASTTIIKIQSFSDLITNSSSETFVIYTKEGIETFKEIISKLLGKDFDEYFTIDIDPCEDCMDEYIDRDESEADLSFEDWCFKHCEDWNDYEGPPAIEGIEINAIHPEDNEAASLIASLLTIFESETRYY